jgi:hypothetical protein
VVNQTCGIQYGGKNLSHGENLSTTTDDAQAENVVKVVIRICNMILRRYIDFRMFLSNKQCSIHVQNKNRLSPLCAQDAG